MSYWELGCNWGRGAPDYYSLLKEKRIVICGDCQVRDAVASAKKIGSMPVPSTARAGQQTENWPKVILPL